MNGKDSPYLILMADGHIEDHELVKKAAAVCNMNMVFTSVYNGSQLKDYILRRGVYQIDPDIHPDLIIMDVNLQGVSSFELIRLLQDQEKMRNIPVCFLTTELQEEQKARAEKLGVKDFFKKPLKEEDWSKVVNEICTCALKWKRGAES